MKGSIEGGAIEQARVLSDRGRRSSMAHKVFNGADLTRHIKGGATTPIFVLDESNSVDQGGQYRLKGGPAQPMIVQPSGRIKGGAAKVVYPVDANGDYDYGFPRSDYAARALSVERDSLIGFWPQDELAGTISYDASPEKNDGAYTGVALGQSGIGDGRTVPYFDGTSDFNQFHSAGLAADFNALSGTWLAWLKADAAMWVDGLWREAVMIRADGNNRLFVVNTNLNNRMRGYYVSGGVVKFQDWFGDGRTAWFTAAITWDKANDELKFFIDGVQSGATVNGLGVWAGALDASYQLIGAGSTAPAEVWQGNIGPCLLYTTVLSQPQLAYLSTL